MGVVQNMPCPKRKPERMLTLKEEDDIMSEIFKGSIGEGVANELDGLQFQVRNSNSSTNARGV